MSDPERSTAEIVREAIERDGSIKIGLARGLINARALARYIQEATLERYTFEALLSAIRRYPIQESADMRVKVGKAIRKLSMKNQVSVILLRNHPDLEPVIAKFTGELDHATGETLRVISTPKVVKLEIDSGNVEKLISKLQKRDLLWRLDNLSEIAVETSRITYTPGVLAALLTELAMNGVNILEISGVGPRSLSLDSDEGSISTDFIMVEEKDGLKAYEALERLCKLK